MRCSISFFFRYSDRQNIVSCSLEKRNSDSEMTGKLHCCRSLGGCCSCRKSCIRFRAFCIYSMFVWIIERKQDQVELQIILPILIFSDIDKRSEFQSIHTLHILLMFFHVIDNKWFQLIFSTNFRTNPFHNWIIYVLLLFLFQINPTMTRNGRIQFEQVIPNQTPNQGDLLYDIIILRNTYVKH
jgi:hypothetical protein